MHNLDAFTRDCFHAIIRNREACSLAHPDPERCHSDTRDQIDRMIGRALAAGIPRYDVYAATFALVSLADAMVARDKGPMGQYWRNHTLEPHYFADSHTQASFVERLEEARHHQRTDLLRVYATCLALGYRGSMRSDDAEQLLATLQMELQPTVWANGTAPILPQPRLRKALPLYWLSFAACMVGIALYLILGSAIRHDAARVTGAADTAQQGN